MDIRLTAENRKTYELFIRLMQVEAEQASGTWQMLNSCKAWYKDCYNGDLILRSYNTIVAAIPAADPTTCYDFSRVVYGYTATTNQHISKFAKQFNATKVIIRGYMQ